MKPILVLFISLIVFILFQFRRPVTRLEHLLEEKLHGDVRAADADEKLVALQERSVVAWETIASNYTVKAPKIRRKDAMVNAVKDKVLPLPGYNFSITPRYIYTR